MTLNSVALNMRQLTGIALVVLTIAMVVWLVRPGSHESTVQTGQVIVEDL